MARPDAQPRNKAVKLPETNLPEDRVRRPLIKPTDGDWILVETEFRKLLSNTKITYGSILDAYFDDWDRKLFWPTTHPESLADIQKSHSRRYKQLLGGRFRGHQVSMATKFAMLWFGLPIEPIISAVFDPARYLIGDLDDEDIEEVEVRPPLHFLTAHDQRNWGLDWRRGREARFSTMPVPASTVRATETQAPSLHLRGGAGPDDEEAGDSDAEDSDDSDVIMLEPQGGEGEHNLHAPSLLSPIRGVTETGDDADYNGDAETGSTHGTNAQKRYTQQIHPVVPTLILHGYQGRAPVDVRLRDDAESAIRALLAVRPGSSCDVVSVRYAVDTGHKIGSETFPEPKYAYSELLDYIAEHNETPDKVAWFIHRVGERSPARPIPEPSNDMVEISDAANQPGRVAYLRLPALDLFSVDGYNRPFGYNDYMPFFKTAQDVLFGPPKFGNQGPHALVTFTNQDGSAIVGSDNKPINTSWHGGLEVDSNFVQWLHPGDPALPNQRSLSRQDYAEPRQITFLVPGDKNQGRYTANPPFYREAFDSLKRLRKDLFAGKNMLSFRIWHGIDFFDVGSPGSRRTPLIWDQQPEAEEDEFLFSLEKFLTAGNNYGSHRGYFYWVQPLYAETGDADDRHTTCGLSYALSGQIGAKPTLPFDEDLESIVDFRNLVDRLYSAGNSDEDRWKSRRVVLYADDMSGHGWNPNKFVIHPRTTSAELSLIRRFLPGRDITFLIEDDDSDFVEDLHSTSATVFGPRYGPVERFREIFGLDGLPPYSGPVMDAEKRKWDHKRNMKMIEAAGKKPGAGQPPKQKQEQKPTGPARPQKDMRVESWSKKLSIYDTGIYNPSIPVNAPPVEKLLRPAESTPAVSLGVLTPTEQRRMQEGLHDLRNQTLLRNFVCQYDDCQFQYRSDDYRAIRDHLKTVHMAVQCPWCEEPLYAHWNPEQRDEHFRVYHGDKLRDVLDVHNDSSPGRDPHTQRQDARTNPINNGTRGVSSLMRPGPLSEMHPKRPLGPPAARQAPLKAHHLELEYNFCDRCGRDHRLLDNAADRKHHDRLCVPHAEGAGHCKFCEECGLHIWSSKEAARKWDPLAREMHQCRGIRNMVGQPHCEACGLTLASLNSDYASTHETYCGGFASKVGSFCPYCQEDLESSSKGEGHLERTEVKRNHIIACRKRNVDSARRLTQAVLTPFDVYDKAYWTEESLPYDDLWHGPENGDADSSIRSAPNSQWAPNYLRSNLRWYEIIGHNNASHMPLTCPETSCGAALVGLLPTQVLAHFETAHGGRRTECPICELDFKVPDEYRTADENEYERRYQVRHLECHVFGLWDVLDGKAGAAAKPAHGTPLPPGHPLWDPFEEGLDKRHKRCPLFDECGAMVGFMTAEQWTKHVEKAHAGGGLNDVETEAQRNIARETFRRMNDANEKRRTNSEVAVTGRAEPTRAPEPTRAAEGGSEPTSIATRLRPSRTTTVPEASRPTTAAPEPTRAAAGLGRSPPITIPESSRPALSQARLTATNKAVVTGPEADAPAPLRGGKPEGDFYCSRCFRKAPQPGKHRPKEGEPSIEEQWAAHTDPNRSCRTEGSLDATVFAPGSAGDTGAKPRKSDYSTAIVPNGVGWIRKEEWNRITQGAFKDAYLKKFPGYKDKIVETSAGNRNPWSGDPNNSDKKALWTDDVAPPFNAGDSPNPGPPAGGPSGGGGDNSSRRDDDGSTRNPNTPKPGKEGPGVKRLVLGDSGSRTSGPGNSGPSLHAAGSRDEVRREQEQEIKKEPEQESEPGQPTSGAVAPLPSSPEEDEHGKPKKKKTPYKPKGPRDPSYRDRGGAEEGDSEQEYEELLAEEHPGEGLDTSQSGSAAKRKYNQFDPTYRPSKEELQQEKKDYEDEPDDISVPKAKKLKKAGSKAVG